MSFLQNFTQVDSTTFFKNGGNVILTNADAGTHFMCAPDAVDYIIIELPDPYIKGMHFMFTKVNDDNTNLIQLYTNEGLFVGSFIKVVHNQLDGLTFDESDNMDVLVFTDDSVPGDFIHIVSNGTNWVVTGCSNATVAAGLDASTV